VDGRLISSDTKLPIDNAKVKLVGRNIEGTSNEKGSFSIGEHTGFCYPVELQVSLEKHKPFRITIENESDEIIYKVESESYFIYYDEPFYPDTNHKGTYFISASIEKYSSNFTISDDSIIIYLEENNLEKEILEIKNSIRNIYSKGQ